MPYYGYYGIDMYYIVLVLPCVLFAFWAQNKVNSTFNRYSRVQNLRGLTGAHSFYYPQGYREGVQRGDR